jgi:hypothetical protein
LAADAYEGRWRFGRHDDARDLESRGDLDVPASDVLLVDFTHSLGTATLSGQSTGP